MGVSINNVSVAELKDGIDFILESERREAADLPVAVRTADGTDGHFYLDIEDGRMLITPDSFYAKAKAGRKGNADAPALTARERQQLADLYDAILGAVCENGEDFFDGYHKRRGKGLMNELEAICRKLAPVEFAKVVASFDEAAAAMEGGAES